MYSGCAAARLLQDDVVLSAMADTTNGKGAIRIRF